MCWNTTLLLKGHMSDEIVKVLGNTLIRHTDDSTEVCNSHTVLANKVVGYVDGDCLCFACLHSFFFLRFLSQSNAMWQCACCMRVVLPRITATTCCGCEQTVVTKRPRWTGCEGAEGRGVLESDP